MRYFKKNNPFYFFVALLVLLCINNAAAETLLKKDFKSFNVELENELDSVLLVINGKNKEPKVIDLFELQSPNRIVLDVGNINASSNSNYTVSKNSEIQKIRIGKHSEKVRFVLDVKEGEISKFDVLKSTGNNLIVKLNKKIAIANKANNSVTRNINTPKMQNNVNRFQGIQKTQQAQKQQMPLLKKNPNQGASIVNNTTNVADETVSKPKTETAKSDKEETPKLIGDQGLENIKFYFKKDKKTPLVRFMFVNKPKYTIKKKDDKKYLLTIENARIRWPHLELPQFPPRDFRGFTMIMPAIKNGNLEIVVGVERGSKVVSFTKDSEVWLKVENYS